MGKQECTFTGCRCANFRSKGSSTKFCACGHKRKLHMASDDNCVVSTVPPYWTNAGKDTATQTFMGWSDCCGAVVRQIQQIVDSSVKQVWTRDRGKAGSALIPVPSGFEVVKVQRNENSKI